MYEGVIRRDTQPPEDRQALQSGVPLCMKWRKKRKRAHGTPLLCVVLLAEGLRKIFQRGFGVLRVQEIAIRGNTQLPQRRQALRAQKKLPTP